MSFEMWSGLIALLVLVVVGVPIVFAFAASAALGLYFALGGLDPMINLLQQSALSGIKEYNFIVIPCFTVMGMLIAHCGAASDLFNVVNRGLRGVPGRLAVATVGGNAVFAAVTGVGVAAAAAFSHVAYPAMREARYSRSFATGCIAGSSVLGLLIPPSVFMIVWAILTEQSVGKLFAAGVFPGLLLALLYAVYCMVYAKLRPSAAPEMASDQQVRLTRGQIGGSLGVGVLIAVTLGGIWFGYFTPTEGSAVGLVGSAILAWAKGMRGRGVFNAFVEAGRTVTPIMLLLLTATMFSKLVALNGIPQEVQALLDHVGKDQPRLIEDLVPKALPLGTVQRVLQSLLEEGVAIRDMRSIIETLADYAPRTQDTLELTSRVRVALGRAIVQQLFPGTNELSVMTLDNRLERLLMQAMGAGGDGVGHVFVDGQCAAQFVGIGRRDFEGHGEQRAEQLLRDAGIIGGLGILMIVSLLLWPNDQELKNEIGALARSINVFRESAIQKIEIERAAADVAPAQAVASAPRPAPSIA